MPSDTPPVCDYEGSDYRVRFWEGQERGYEDSVERIALRRLMPPTGSTLIEIGAGFGRLAEEYKGYERVVLFDYSQSLLREAQSQLHTDPRFIYVAGNWYKMPFVSGLFETLVQIRTLHHAADVPALLQQLHRIARFDSSYILEFANKQNLKAILRFFINQQSWSPFAHDPIEFVELNYNFHPRWIEEQLQLANFLPARTLTVSRFRLALLKRIIPTKVLTHLDGLLQWTGNWWQLAPSVFVKSSFQGNKTLSSVDGFFACPECFTPLNNVINGRLTCSNSNCQREWGVENGIYNFKEPLN